MPNKVKKLKHKPDFIVIGAQKAGTTFLRSILMQHSDIYMPQKPVEVHYFNRDISKMKAYEMLFKDVSEGLIKGEKTPAYMHMSLKRIKNLKKQCPNIKLILILRNPVDRAWSQARMETSDWNRKKIRDRDFIRLLWNILDLRNTERSNYVKALEKWLSVFDRKDLYIDFYDNLEENPQVFLKGIYTFLGAREYYPPTLTTRVFQGKHYEIPGFVKQYLNKKNRKNFKKLKQLNVEFPSKWSKNNSDKVSDFRSIFYIYALLPFSIVRNLSYMIYKKIIELYHFNKPLS